MAEKKPPQVAESPIAEIFEGRHPSEPEKQWAEKTLAPTLEKSPERPIGARTGTNLDENGDARFTTISGVPIRRLYTSADLPTDWNYENYLNYPGQPPFTRGIHATGYRAVCSPCGSSPDLLLRKKRTNATNIYSITAEGDCRLHSICRL